MKKPPGDPLHDDDRLGRAFDQRLLIRLLRHGLPYRGLMARAVVLILATTALGLAGPFAVKWAIDGPLRAAIAGGTAAPGAARGLLTAVALYAAATALALVLRFRQGMAMSTVGQRVMHDLRLEVFGHLQRMPVGYYDRTPVGRLTTRVSNDIEALNQLFTSGFVTFIADLLVLVGITVALIAVNVPLALTTLGVVPPLALVTLVFRRAAQKHYREQRGHLAHLNGFSQESLQGLSVIQLFNRERETGRRFRGINRDYLAAFQRTVLCYSLYFPAVEVIAAGALAAILWRGGAGLRAGSLSLGEFYLFWHFLGKFMNPIRDMAERYNVLQAAMAAAERIFKVLDTPAPEREAPQRAERPAGGLPSSPPPAALALRGEVEFQDVWFSYGALGDGAGAPFAARGISFRVEPGETVAIVGATGAGKSTIVNLLTRFYEPERGRILLDGRDLAGYPARELRRRIGLVLQDPFLFSRSVRENIRLGRREVPDEAVEAAARRTRAHEVIQGLPGGYDAVLGERGGGISAGEKQLLAFARALAGDPDILVLDEATSAIDPATEALIQGALRELLRGRTAVVIAHRLSTVRAADRIVVLHKGEVREAGSHQELLLRRGIYERLWRLQLEAGAGPSRPAGASGAEEAGAGGESAQPEWPAPADDADGPEKEIDGAPA